jgi:hypothetical protein
VLHLSGIGLVASFEKSLIVWPEGGKSGSTRPASHSSVNPDVEGRFRRKCFTAGAFAQPRLGLT